MISSRYTQKARGPNFCVGHPAIFLKNTPENENNGENAFNGHFQVFPFQKTQATQNHHRNTVHFKFVQPFNKNSLGNFQLFI